MRLRLLTGRGHPPLTHLATVAFQDMRFSNNPLNLLLPSLLLIGSSCATILTGTSQAVSIDSNVQGASVIIDGNQVGVTPFNGKIKKQQEAVATIRKEGYAQQSVTLTSSFNPVATLSIFWDFTTTDFLTGAAWEYAPNSYYVDLKPKNMSAAEYQRGAELKAFAMTHAADLRIELAAGFGPLLDSLHEGYAQDLSIGDLVAALEPLAALDAVAFGEEVQETLGT
jgi:hypothetical protein